MKLLRRSLSLCLCLCLAVGAARLLHGADTSPAAPSAEDFLVLPAAAPEADPAPAETAAEPELRGLWVPYLSLRGGDEAAFRQNFSEILSQAGGKGVNALFVHVRPFCDALYPSALFPWSHILTGTQGQDPGFDPLAFMVEECHRAGLAFHAWINPLRVKTAQTPAVLSPDNPYESLREDCPYYFMEWEGSVWLNPAWPYIRTLIARGAAEIAENYPVDGVHFDDYFYPAEDDSLDWQAYELYAETADEPLPLPEWRAANITALLQEVHSAVHLARPEAVFGVAPQGNLSNDMAMGADVAAWCAAPGCVDYLCPQLYYSFENPALSYGEALSDWLAIPRFEGLKLYAGLALYKVDSDADGGTWAGGSGVITRQAEEARAAQCAGVVLYAADYLDKLEPFPEPEPRAEQPP